RRLIKLSYLGLASLERTIARQRARIASLKDGDANTTLYHRQCTYRKHFDTRIGTDVPRDCTIDPSQFIEPSNLEDLDAPFSEYEIWQAIKSLPSRK
uniref:Uncharacterized protein n=1 Tax=Aegilops tauschii subsp. strangulata TaxID=200361 RepID=A0A453RCE2_AEGTS